MKCAWLLPLVLVAGCRHDLPMPDLNRVLVLSGTGSVANDPLLAFLVKQDNRTLALRTARHEAVEGIVALGFGRKLTSALYAERSKDLCSWKVANAQGVPEEGACELSVAQAQYALGRERDLLDEYVIERGEAVVYVRISRYQECVEPQAIEWTLSGRQSHLAWSNLHVREAAVSPHFELK